MVALRALLYALAIFVALGVIAMVVAAIMRLMYAVLHRGEKKAKSENKVEAKAAPQ
jgi:hypothetical protein